MTSLLSTSTFVESPFVIVKIGKYTFGSYTDRGNLNKYGSSLSVTYPNYMQSIDITKINGVVGLYTIKMVYPIAAGDDPNMLDKVFSSVGFGTITISYGDWCLPTFIYKEEEAIISKVQSSVDFSGSRIFYTITCTSSALSLKATKFDFPKRFAKPSNVIKEILYNRKYGLLDVFYGMTDKQMVANLGLILSDDKAVTIEAKKSIGSLEYLNYLVTCMSSLTNVKESNIKDSNYYLNVVDDITGQLKGPYFKITKVGTVYKNIDNMEVYELDVGYPGDNMVTSFNIKNDESWSLFYKYSNAIDQSQYVYRVNNDGQITSEYSPMISNSPTLMRTTEASKNWWTQMTSYPISASITIKGLLRPSILMTYLKLNVVFYGQKHTSSGLYIITKQQDVIDGSGYRTMLSLQRLSGDEVENTSSPTSGVLVRGRSVQEVSIA